MAGYDDRDRDYDQDDRGRYDRGGGGGDYENAKQKVQLPAIFLMVTAALSIAANLVGILMNFRNMGSNAAMDPPDQKGAYMAGIFMAIAGLVLGILLHGLVLFGALKMK